jgi:RNA polymerase sigma-70 factor, ECF subfamily
MTSERALLDAARRGSHEAFRELVEPHRTDLHAHAYRMLGSTHDAEDALQEAMLDAWRGLATFEGRSSIRVWLHKIATNACLRLIARRPKRMLPADYSPAAEDRDFSPRPLVESIWVEPYPDQMLGLEEGFAGPEARYERRESVELAFIAMVQHLPPRQRAVLLLREVLGFSAREVAEALDTTVASVNSALQRARKAVDERIPAQSQQAALRALGDERVRELVERYVAAWEAGDANAILALLTDDATFAMPPDPTWYSGRDAIAAFLPKGPLRDRWRFIPARVNGQLAFATYNWDAERGLYVAHAVDVLALEGARVKEITAFLTPDGFADLGLPNELHSTDEFRAVALS